MCVLFPCKSTCCQGEQVGVSTWQASAFEHNNTEDNDSGEPTIESVTCKLDIWNGIYKSWTYMYYVNKFFSYCVGPNSL